MHQFVTEILVCWKANISIKWTFSYSPNIAAISRLNWNWTTLMPIANERNRIKKTNNIATPPIVVLKLSRCWYCCIIMFFFCGALDFIQFSNWFLIGKHFFFSDVVGYMQVSACFAVVVFFSSNPSQTTIWWGIPIEELQMTRESVIKTKRERKRVEKLLNFLATVWELWPIMVRK